MRKKLMHDYIVDLAIRDAVEQNKSILILGNPRSGTHALASHIHVQLPDYEYFGQICSTDGTPRPWDQIEKLYTSSPALAHIIDYNSKSWLAADVDCIHQHCVIINIRRENKVKQFASLTYFNLTGGVNNPELRWHNHLSENTVIEPGTVTASEDQINQFIAEQLVDNFFSPDYFVNYEKLSFNRSKIVKNQFSYDLPLMFKNLDYVTERLGHWKYSSVYNPESQL